MDLSSTRKLHLLLPDILWPLEENRLKKPSIRASTLEKLLTRARRVPFQGNGTSETLFHIFGIEADSNADYPAGAVSHFGHGGESSEKCCAKATPVHLVADGDRVLLVGPAQLNITRNEAEKLARDFNEHFKQDGLSLLIQDQNDWCLQLPQCPEIKTYDIDFVDGRHIDHYLPIGPDSAEWVNISNETQMLFYQNEINQQRMSSERAAINGLWFSGFGRLPAVSKGYGAIYSTLPLAKGLARLSNTTHCEATNGFDEIRCLDQETILVSTGFTDAKRGQNLTQWEDALKHIDQGLRRIIDSDACEEFSIYSCRGSAFHVNRKRIRAGFWKPNKTIFNVVN